MQHSRILAIDVGERRVGLATADLNSRLPSPLKTLTNSDSIYEDIKNIIESESIDTIVLGLPRNLDGEDTDQTRYVRDFADKLKAAIDQELFFEDEALSTVRAKNKLYQEAKPFKKEEIDALAASYILDDFLVSHKEIFNG